MKKPTLLLFTILLAMTATKAFAYDIAVENADGVTIYYNYINDGTELEVTSSTGSYIGYSNVVVIPEEVTFMNRTRKVTSIGYEAFLGNKDLISVTIPTSVMRIGHYAFSNCSGLTTITIPNNVSYIGSYAFYYCSALTSITLPNSLLYIENNTFSGCTSLTSVMIPDSVAFIGSYAFMNCFALSSVKIGKRVTSIDDRAFHQCKSLTSITIPDCVRNIGKGAFAGCLCLTTITIPNNVNTIGSRAFNGCDMAEVISRIENPFPIDKNTFSDNTYNGTLFVPVGTIDKYKATDGWNKFVFIEEGDPSSISDIKGEEANELKRFTLDGKAVKSSHKGINIIRTKNGKSKKVVVK